MSRRDLPEVKDSRQEGDWLHAILEAFFTGKTGKKTLMPPLPSLKDVEDPRAFLLERLTALTNELMPAASHDSPLALHLQRHSWPAFADHVLRLHQAEAPTAAWRERSLHADSQPATVRIGAQEVCLNGKIDSVERWDAWHLITDYKRSGTPDKGAVKSGMSPQLLLYAMAMESVNHRLPVAQATVGYWSILGGYWQGSCHRLRGSSSR